MRIKSTEIDIILEDLMAKKALVTDIYEFLTLVDLQKEWEDYWLEIADLEENESILNWIEEL